MRTRSARLWAYAREAARWSNADPPATVFIHAPDRTAERPEARPGASFGGVLHVDGDAGFGQLTASSRVEARRLLG
ncbi:MAG: transposase [Hyphomonadaceae bacterium]|nr:transposase [Hyphomonadaceae bacterium]